MKDFLKNKGIGWFIIAAASVIAIIFSIIVFATWESWLPDNNTGVGFGLCLLIGGIIGCGLSIFPIKFGAEAQVICFTLAFGLAINNIVDAIAESINQTNYIAANIGGCYSYAIVCLVLAIAAVVACFLPVTTDDSEKI